MVGSYDRRPAPRSSAAVLARLRPAESAATTPGTRALTAATELIACWELRADDHDCVRDLVDPLLGDPRIAVADIETNRRSRHRVVEVWSEGLRDLGP